MALYGYAMRSVFNVTQVFKSYETVGQARQNVVIEDDYND